MIKQHPKGELIAVSIKTEIVTAPVFVAASVVFKDEDGVLWAHSFHVVRHDLVPFNEHQALSYADWRKKFAELCNVQRMYPSEAFMQKHYRDNWPPAGAYQLFMNSWCPEWDMDEKLRKNPSNTN